MIKGRLKHYYNFGIFRIDVTERLLYAAQAVVPLTPKAFDTLLVLVEQSGHVLGKMELMEKVWPDSFVEENNLAQHIFALRRALRKDDGREYIETVPKRGYRFVADVRESFDGIEERPETASDNNTQAGCDERARMKRKSPLRDVVIIGRAINFK